MGYNTLTGVEGDNNYILYTNIMSHVINFQINFVQLAWPDHFNLL